MKFRLISIKDELVHLASKRRALVMKLHPAPLELMDILWLDTHELETRVSPKQFDPVPNADRIYVPK